MNITNLQMKKIFVLARENGLDNEMLHSYVMAVTRRSSIRKLTCVQAGIVIDGLENKPKKRKNKQNTYIAGLVKELGWDNNEERLNGLIKKMFKKDKLQKLNKSEKSKLITALKNIKEDLKDEH